MEKQHRLLVKIGTFILVPLHFFQYLHILYYLILLLFGGHFCKLVLDRMHSPLHVHLGQVNVRQLHFVHHHKEKHRQSQQQYQREPAEPMIEWLSQLQSDASPGFEASRFHPRAADATQRQRNPQHPEQRAAEGLPPRHHHHVPQPHAVDEEKQCKTYRPHAEEMHGKKVSQPIAHRANPVARRTAVGQEITHHGDGEERRKKHIHRTADTRKLTASYKRSESRHTTFACSSLAFALAFGR